MPLPWGVYVGVPLSTIAISVILAVWIYAHHTDVRGWQWFVATQVLMIGWMSAEIVHLGGLEPVVAALGIGSDQAAFVAKAFATKFAIWAFLASALFLSLYTHANFHRHWLARVTLAAIAGVTLLPTWSEPFLSMFYGDARIAEQPFRYVVIEQTVPYAVVAILVTVAMGYAIVATARYMLSMPWRSGLQIGLLVLGSLSFMVAVALGNLDVFGLPGKTHAEFGALPTAILLSLALFRFRLFEVQPVARNALVQDLRDPVLVLDEDGRIVDYNPASTEVWPAVRGSTGEPVGEVCPALADELTLSADRTDDTGPVSLVVDGARRYYSLTVSTVSQGRAGGPDLYSVLLRDVTDLAQSRWQLERQNERLEQVAATVSHDLRNPISVAGGHLDLLADTIETADLDAGAPDDATEHVRGIRAAHDRMVEIIDDVLSLAREGQAVEATETVSLSAVARDAWTHVSTDAATLSISADRQLAADRTKLQTLFENLFRNAVEHAGSDVRVTVGTLPEGFYVADDGPGIPADDADAIFEYGYSTAEEGTGLGLSIVRTIAESHGWTVELDADADGARFCFRNVDATQVADEPARDGTAGVHVAPRSVGGS